MVAFVYALSNHTDANRGIGLDTYLQVDVLLSPFCCYMLIFCGCMLVYLLIHGLFSGAGILWLDLHYRILLQHLDLHPHAIDTEFLQNNYLFSP